MEMVDEYLDSDKLGFFQPVQPLSIPTNSASERWEAARLQIKRACSRAIKAAIKASSEMPASPIDLRDHLVPYFVGLATGMKAQGYFQPARTRGCSSTVHWLQKAVAPFMEELGVSSCTPPAEWLEDETSELNIHAYFYNARALKHLLDLNRPHNPDIQRVMNQCEQDPVLGWVLSTVAGMQWKEQHSHGRHTRQTNLFIDLCYADGVAYETTLKVMEDDGATPPKAPRLLSTYVQERHVRFDAFSADFNRG